MTLNKSLSSTDFARLIVQILPEISGMRIAEVIDVSNEEGYIFHGIKSNKFFYKVNEDGIKAYTPESGASHWTSGTTLFGKIQENNRLLTHDSPFFNYAHSRSPPSEYLTSDESRMTMAVAKYSDLERRGLTQEPFKENGEHFIRKSIPRDLIHLLRVELKYHKKSPSGLSHGVEAEIMMFELIYRTLKGDYKPRGLTVSKY